MILTIVGNCDTLTQPGASTERRELVRIVAVHSQTVDCHWMRHGDETCLGDAWEKACEGERCLSYFLFTEMFSFVCVILKCGVASMEKPPSVWSAASFSYAAKIAACPPGPWTVIRNR